MGRGKISEADFARAVIDWLREDNWEVYQEVQIHHSGHVADIVAVQNNISWIIEVKRSLGFSVLEQAVNWVNWCNYISVAVPQPQRSRIGFDNRVLNQVFREWKLGLIEVSRHGIVTEVREPNVHRNRNNIIDHLVEEQKYWAEAGNCHSNRFTPFQRTKNNIYRYVQENPGCTLKELVDSIKHHYRTHNTARSCISKWIFNGVIKNLRTERDGKKFRIYMSENNNTGVY